MTLVKKPKTLGSLLEGLTYQLSDWSADQSIEECCITTVTTDSRDVIPGSLFVAIAGVKSDGHDFIENAIQSGCSAVLCTTGSPDIEKIAGTVVVTVSCTEDAYAAIAANFFQRPADHLFMVGVTGTNGKTTVTYLLEQVLIEVGYSVGIIGSVNNRYTLHNRLSKVVPTKFTTPEAFLLQKLLRDMVDAGVKYVVMEVSSHALAQSRVGNISFDVAVFTNFSRDHLDYHEDMDEYLHAKSRLFSLYLKKSGNAVLPALQPGVDENSWLGRMHILCLERGIETIGWGDGGNAHIELKDYSSTLAGISMTVMTPSGQNVLSSPLIGRFNIDNILTVIGICNSMNIKTDLIMKALAHTSGAPGRLEKVSGPEQNSIVPVVLVDYAHSPDALEKVLTTVVELPHRNLFCVFGCGGDRDSGKRSVMGEIAGRLCDVVVITDDNPRTENPDAIVTQIVSGLKKAGMVMCDEEWCKHRKQGDRGGLVIRERRQAIESAIRAAGPEDIVVIAGKGHEPYQLTAQGKRFFDDRFAAGSVVCSWTTESVAQAVGGVIPSVSFGGSLLGCVTTDSRIKNTRGVFVALKGENHDGHDFVGQAVKNGACSVVVEKEVNLPAGSDAVQIRVDDSLKALGDLAAFRRKMIGERGKLVVIGITGSCGKTTVKEMVAAILERRWPGGKEYPEDCVLKTRGNFNNLIGLPLSLLPLDVSHKAVVLEMGMNQPGELQRLATIADPDISCITNINGAHLECLHSIEGVALAKEELFAVTRTSGKLVINLDDHRICSLAEKYPHEKITYSSLQIHHGHVDLWASDIRLAVEECLTFTLNTTEKKIEIQLSIIGEHNVSNAMAAAAIATAAGVALDHIAAGLADFKATDKRMEVIMAEAGYRIINDTYNANPASMAAGLKTLKQMAGGTSVAIIGDMLELGASSVEAHNSIGTLLAKLGVDYVGVVGEFRQEVLKGAVANGFDEDKIHIFDNKESVVFWMKEMVKEEKIGRDDLVLVKASRGLRFETIVEQLT